MQLWYTTTHLMFGTNDGWSVERSAETAGNEGNGDVSTLTAATKCAFRFIGDSKGSR
jgi:hypothetical protein